MKIIRGRKSFVIFGHECINKFKVTVIVTFVMSICQP
jgi:hypothetical protein